MKIIINFSLKEDGSILLFLENIPSFLLVAIGAIFGSNTRFIIYEKLDRFHFEKDIKILFINCLSSFFLGLFLALSSHLIELSYFDQIGLFFSIGFLGSLSTFSTFIYDLFELSLLLKFNRALIIFGSSLFLGIIFFAFGGSLGNQ